MPDTSEKIAQFCTLCTLNYMLFAFGVESTFLLFCTFK